MSKLKSRAKEGVNESPGIPPLVKCEMACCAMSNVLNQKTKWVNGPFKQVQYTSHNSHLTFDKWGGQPIHSHVLKPATTYSTATTVCQVCDCPNRAPRMSSRAGGVRRSLNRASRL